MWIQFSVVQPPEESDLVFRFFLKSQIFQGTYKSFLYDFLSMLSVFALDVNGIIQYVLSYNLLF